MRRKKSQWKLEQKLEVLRKKLQHRKLLRNWNRKTHNKNHPKAVYFDICRGNYCLMRLCVVPGMISLFSASRKLFSPHLVLLLSSIWWPGGNTVESSTLNQKSIEIGQKLICGDLYILLKFRVSKKICDSLKSGESLINLLWFKFYTDWISKVLNSYETSSEINVVAHSPFCWPFWVLLDIWWWWLLFFLLHASKLKWTQMSWWPLTSH